MVRCGGQMCCSALPSRPVLRGTVGQLVHPGAVPHGAPTVRL